MPGCATAAEEVFQDLRPASSSWLFCCVNLQVTITHDGKGPPIRVPREQQQEDGTTSLAQQQQDAATKAAEGSKRHKDSKRSRQREQQQQKQQQPQRQEPAATSSSRAGRHRQQQQEQLPQLRTSQPRPHPFYIKPKHVKRHFRVTTVDGWKLHLIRLVICSQQHTVHSSPAPSVGLFSR